MCSPISEDFPIAAIRRRRQMLFIIYCVCGCCCICVRFSNFVLPNLFMIIMVLISKAMSPIRFIIIAFIPDLLACVRLTISGSLLVVRANSYSFSVLKIDY